jgi:hypothetical protein
MTVTVTSKNIDLSSWDTLFVYMYVCMKCSMLYKSDGLWLNICACCSWKISLSINLDGSFDDIHHWERILEKAVEFNNTKTCIKIIKLSFAVPSNATQIDLKRNVSEFSHWIYMDQGRNPSRALVNTVMNLCCSVKIGEYHYWLNNSHIVKNGSVQWS